MEPHMSTLKAKHAEHIIEVVRDAKKREARRQKRLRHTKSKANYAYLEKRFDGERRQDQTHISRLLQDANLVEAAMNNGSRTSQDHQHHQRRGESAESSGDGDLSYRVRNAATADSAHERAPSAVGSVPTTKSITSNAYVEPSWSKDDPNFISLDKMRFMKYLYARVEGERAARAHTRDIGTKIVCTEKSADKLERRRRRNEGSGDVASIERRRGDNVRRIKACLSRGNTGGGGGGGGGGGNSDYRQRLLEEKRGILLEMKGIVGRQAEALDRLLESSAHRNRVPVLQGGGDAAYNRTGNIRRAANETSRASDGSSVSSVNFFSRGKMNNVGSSNTGSRSFSRGGQTTRSASEIDVSKVVVRNAPSTLPPPRPPNNDTSAFLARGGRWEGENTRSASTRGSVGSASSASYATYCTRGGWDGKAKARCGVGRRPRIVPTLRV